MKSPQITKGKGEPDKSDDTNRVSVVIYTEQKVIGRV